MSHPTVDAFEALIAARLADQLPAVYVARLMEDDEKSSPAVIVACTDQGEYKQWKKAGEYARAIDLRVTIEVQGVRADGIGTLEDLSDSVRTAIETPWTITGWALVHLDPVAGEKDQDDKKQRVVLAWNCAGALA